MGKIDKWIRLLVLAAATSLAGCAAHSPMILKNTTDVALKSQTKSEAYVGKVLFVEKDLPKDVKYEVLGEVNAGRIWYGGADSVLNQMGDKAREIGADAMINVATWHQPSGFSWAAPHGHGTAVKILNKTSVDLSTVQGTWH